MFLMALLWPILRIYTCQIWIEDVFSLPQSFPAPAGGAVPDLSRPFHAAVLFDSGSGIPDTVYLLSLLSAHIVLAAP